MNQENFNNLTLNLAEELGESCTQLNLQSEPELVALFKSLVACVGLSDNPKLAVSIRTAKEEKYCDDYYCRKFMGIANSKGSKRHRLQGCLETFDKKLDYDGWRKIGIDRHFTENQAEIFICCSAFVHDRTLKQHLAEFFQYCRVEGINLNCAKSNERAISTLIAQELKTNSVASTPTLPLLDSIALQNEIQVIRKELDAYPYTKNKSRIENSTKSESALIRVDNLLSSVGDNPNLLALKAVLLLNLKRDDEALKLAKELYEGHKNNFEVQLANIHILARNDFFKEAIEISEEARKQGDSIRLLYGTGFAYENMGNYEEAIKYYLMATEKDRDYIQPFLRLSVCYERLGRYKEWEFAITHALEIAPTDQVIILDYMSGMSKLNRTDEGMKKLKSLDSCKIIEKLTFAKYFENIDLKKTTFQDIENIIREMTRELEANPFELMQFKYATCLTAGDLLLTMYLELQCHDTALQFERKYIEYAIECYKLALSFDSENYNGYKSLYKAYFSKLDFSESKKYFKLWSEKIKVIGVNGEKPWIDIIEFAKEIGEKLDVRDHPDLMAWCEAEFGDYLGCQIELAGATISACRKDAAQHHLNEARKIFEGQSGIPDIDCHLGLAQLLRQFFEVWPAAPEYLSDALCLVEKCLQQHENIQGEAKHNALLMEKGRILIAIGRQDDDVNSFDQAIALYSKLLSCCKRLTQSEFWADINSNLSVAYEYIGYIRNDDTAFQKSIAHCKSGLMEIDVKSDPFLPPKICANARWMRLLGKERVNETYLREAVDLYRYAIRRIDKVENTTFWCDINIAIGECFIELNEINENSNNMEDAKEYFRAATKIDREFQQSTAWKGLGFCFRCLGNSNGGIFDLIKSRKAYSMALALIDKEADLAEWALVQLQIGIVVQNIAMKKSDIKTHSVAVLMFEEIIESLKGTNLEKNSYHSYHNKGLGLFEIYRLETNDNIDKLKESVNSFSCALEKRADEKDSWEFANTQYSLGNSLFLLGEAEKNASFLNEAIGAYKKALEYFTKSSHPIMWKALKDNTKEVKTLLAEINV